MLNELCVVGLGYVGLPTAALFARAGVRVLGVDVNEKILAAVARGESPIEEPGLDALLRECIASGRLATAGAPAPSEAFLIAVGTPVGPAHEPDLRALHAASGAIARVLKPGDLVVVESTVPPGTTSRSVREALERGSGLVAGRDFHLAHCAERAIPGSALREMVENDRIVGGVDAASTKAAAALYARMVKGTLLEADSVTSEIVKLAENTYRDVNIAYANELARICERLGADAGNVIDLANRHPRVHIHRPGPGVGGHCIPVVPWFLVAAAPDATDVIRAARAVNDAQPGRVVERLVAELGSAAPTARVAVLGVAYKEGIDDTRETPALDIIRALEARGIQVRATDPHVTRFERPLVPLDRALDGADALVVVNAERAYRDLPPAHAARAMRGRLVLDARGALDAGAWNAAGFRVRTLGVGDRP